MKAVIIKLIKLYQLSLSLVLPPSCRFYPSCSEYTRQAVEQHGACRGAMLGIKRICKCHPFHPGGYDPVPSAHNVIAAKSVNFPESG